MGDSLGTLAQQAKEIAGYITEVCRARGSSANAQFLKFVPGSSGLPVQLEILVSNIDNPDAVEEAAQDLTAAMHEEVQILARSNKARLLIDLPTIRV
jgi:hypothetical protein